jgi:hypothetical protein
MSDKPTGVLLLAILQLIGALLSLYAGGLLLMVALALGPFGILAAPVALILFIIGIIGLILFYGLYTLKGWAWLWALIINLLGILGGVLQFNALFTDYASLGSFILLVPSTKAHFR